jgi:hypothetical protein
MDPSTRKSPTERTVPIVEGAADVAKQALAARSERSVVFIFSSTYRRLVLEYSYIGGVCNC